MSNDSTAPGYLTPVSAPQAYDETLERELSQWARALSGLPSGMVRPRWTATQAALPAADTNWCGFGIVGFTADNAPAFMRQTDEGNQLWRHEVIETRASFYGPQSQSIAMLFRDGLAVAPIADHAYKRPAELTMEVGFSGGGSLLDFASSLTATSLLGLSPRETYQSLLDLQASRVPFNVVTGKRIYSNMLIRVLDVTTDRASENVLMASLTLREVIISQTQTISVANKSDMTDGVSTSPLQNTGTKSVKSANESILSKLSSNF